MPFGDRTRTANQNCAATGRPTANLRTADSRKERGRPRPPVSTKVLGLRPHGHADEGVRAPFLNPPCTLMELSRLLCRRKRPLAATFLFTWILAMPATKTSASLLGTNLFPADNPWNQNISQAPVA